MTPGPPGDGSGNDTTPGPSPDAETICSAKGCTAPARWVLAWNNPKLHTPDRRKTWLACDLHRTTLGDHLEVRGFLREVTPLERRA